MELGWSYPKRKKYLEDLAGKVTGKTQAEYFQNQTQDFAVHIIPIELPKYRIDNGRTYAAQAQYIAKKDLPKDFFSKDHESEAVQSAQHSILKEMTKDKGLFDYFKTHEQSNAIILSHEGYVINGNRRLCAWRELYESDKKKYSKLSHIRVIVLPPADPKDIDELEARLQVHKDIKADYTWTSRALMLKNRQAAYNYTIKNLADLFEMSKSDVEELIDMLFYAENYLENRDKVGQYNLLDRAEFAFRQLHKRRSKIKGEPYKEVFEKLAFCLIDKSEEGRLYQSIPDLADHLDKIIENIEEEFDIEDEEASAGTKLLGGQNYGSLNGVIKVLTDEKNYEQARTIAMDVIEGEKVKQKEKSKRNFVHSQVKKANTALLEAVAAIDTKTKKEGISAQAESIEASIEKIKAWLGDEDKN
jgi:hypothetical protein